VRDDVLALRVRPAVARPEVPVDRRVPVLRGVVLVGLFGPELLLLLVAISFFSAPFDYKDITSEFSRS
jgi:hypothetical protein